ncbi:MAG: hypothetical protein ACO1RX_14470 [Candidatus Sericytochromatia bacterium]
MLYVQGGLSRFHYDFTDAEARPLGTLDMPTYDARDRTSASYSRIANNPKHHVIFDWQGTRFRLEYTRFDDKRGIRYFLMPEPPPTRDTILASGALSRRSAPWQIDWQDQRYTLVRPSRWRGVFELRQGERVLGHVRETTPWLALRRRFEVELPADMPLSMQGFLFYLATSQMFG